MRDPRRFALLGVALLAVAFLGPRPAEGQSLPAASAPISGTAVATAIVTRVTPGVGSLNLGFSTGVALTNLTNNVAQAQAEALDLGLIGALLVALEAVDSDQLPTPLRVDNRNGDVAAEVDEYPVSGAELGGGRKQARATTLPSATATATVASSFGPIVSVDGGTATATSTAVPGGREARASVSVDLTIAGLVELSGLRWDARHRTGTDPVSEATFSVASAAIGGVPVPVEALGPLGVLVNTALEPSGVSVQLPSVERSDATTDLVRITPLRVMLKDSPVGKATLGPVLNLTRAQREQLFVDVTRQYATAAPALLAADVAVAIAAGQGFLSVEVGGAEASSGDLALDNPFGDLGPGAGEGSARIPSNAPVPLPSGGARPVEPPQDVARRGDAAVGPLEDRCESIHPARPLSCSGGSLLPVGLAGLASAAAVAGLDLRHQRQRRAVLAAAAGAVGGAGGVGGVGGAPGWGIVRSYAPIVAVAGAFVVLAIAVAVPRAHLAYEGSVTVPDPTGAAGAGSGGAAGGVTTGEPAYGSAALGSAVAPVGGAGQVRSCPDRAVQVPGDPYSPPCYAFSGRNGGATTMGVTEDTITVSIRQVEAGSATDIFAAIAGQSLEDSMEATQNTLDALAEYFSTRFQFYGRRLKLEFFRGEGNGINELLGGGKEHALADAVRAAQELHAFADLSSITLPYADGLARHQVVNLGAPYPSRAWFEARRPYSWSIFPDGTNVVEATSSAMVGRYPPGSTAEHAGGSLQGLPRRFATIAPENNEYQESMNVLLDLLRGAGIDVALNMKYKLDLASMPNQASNIIAQLKDAGVTSAVCLCDPAMLAFGMTPKANEQDYFPEWITAGLVFVDQDVVAQAIETRQWSRAFGTAYNAESERSFGSFPYSAYKSVRPSDEPALGVEELYYQMYMLAIGIQMAGPNLTPDTFEAGMFAYPGGFGPRGTWGFGQGDYTPTNDYREIWWDPERTSEQNDKKGAWAELSNGQRYSPASPPRGRAPFFEEG